MNSLISSDQVWLLWAVILVGVAASIYLEQRYKWAAKLSGPVLALLMAMALSNLRVMPSAAPTYDTIQTYLVPVAIPLLLFRANLFHIMRTTGSMFLAFHVSAAGTMLGAILAVLTLGPYVPEAHKVAAIMTGSYTGGGVNFFALKSTYELPDRLTAGLLVADNFIMAGMFIALLVLAGSRWVRARYPHPHSAAEDSQQAQLLAAEHWKRKEISLLDLAKAMAVAVSIAALGQTASAWIKSRLGSGAWGAILGNAYLLITVLSVLVSTLFHRTIQRIHGGEELGGYLLYIFLFVIGLPVDLSQFVKEVPYLFGFCLIMALVNLGFTLGIGKLLRLPLEELLLSVNATLGGAPTATAMAIAKGWPKLVLPALLTGIWGYVIGTFLGLVIGETLLRWRSF